MELLLKGLRWYNQNQWKEGDIRISNGYFNVIEDNISPLKSDKVIPFKNKYIYPGLINSHDHLEMNLYSRMGKPPYRNYIEWSKDIYKPKESPVKEIESVDINDRLLFGGLKNIISGVTTVVHHNPWRAMLGDTNFPVKVLRNYEWAHSLGFSKNLKQPTTSTPFIIHAAEGIDELTAAEITKLNDLNFLNEHCVLVHCINIDNRAIEKISQAGTSVIWCPQSNLFMFNKTAPVDQLKNNLRVALGTDSSMTGSPTLLDEIQVAKSTNLATSSEIFQMVQSIPASIFNITQPQINEGRPADFIITDILDENYYDNLISVKPSNVRMVTVNGIPRIIDPQICGDIISGKNKIHVDGSLRFVSMDTRFLNRIEKIVGNTILEQNPIWRMIQS